jgi:hypothetical protein
MRFSCFVVQKTENLKIHKVGFFFFVKWKVAFGFHSMQDVVVADNKARLKDQLSCKIIFQWMLKYIFIIQMYLCDFYILG